MRYPETAALILKARKRTGLSQEKAAQKVGCSRLQFINWEQGVHRPTRFTGQLVEVLGIDSEQLESCDGGLDEAQMDLMGPLTDAISAIVAMQVKRAMSGREQVA